MKDYRDVLYLMYMHPLFSYGFPTAIALLLSHFLFTNKGGKMQENSITKTTQSSKCVHACVHTNTCTTCSCTHPHTLFLSNQKERSL